MPAVVPDPGHGLGEVGRADELGIVLDERQTGRGIDGRGDHAVQVDQRVLDSSGAVSAAKALDLQSGSCERCQLLFAGDLANCFDVTVRVVLLACSFP